VHRPVGAVAGMALEEPEAAIALACSALGQRRSGKKGIAVETGSEDRGGAVQWRRLGLPIAGCAPLLDRNRVCRWGAGGSEEPRDSCPRPHLIFILHSATGAHQPRKARRP
jgi:hypothetical protein